MVKSDCMNGINVVVVSMAFVSESFACVVVRVNHDPSFNGANCESGRIMKQSNATKLMLQGCFYFFRAIAWISNLNKNSELKKSKGEKLPNLRNLSNIKKVDGVLGQNSILEKLAIAGT